VVSRSSRLLHQNRNQLDLTDFYNADLLTTPHAARNLNEALNNNLKQFPQGIQEFNGIRFDIRGLVVLNSLNIKISPRRDKTVPATTARHLSSIRAAMT
jgi:hypothetical protein